MMSEEVQHRALEEDLESEEGDLESFLEEESSSELLERVRELQVSQVFPPHYITALIYIIFILQLVTSY